MMTLKGNSGSGTYCRVAKTDPGERGLELLLLVLSDQQNNTVLILPSPLSHNQQARNDHWSRKEKDKALRKHPLSQNKALSQHPLPKNKALSQHPLSQNKALSQHPLSQNKALSQHPLPKNKGLKALSKLTVMFLTHCSIS